MLLMLMKSIISEIDFNNSISNRTNGSLFFFRIRDNDNILDEIPVYKSDEIKYKEKQKFLSLKFIHSNVL